jgi:hypothetical protein
MRVSPGGNVCLTGVVGWCSATAMIVSPCGLDAASWSAASSTRALLRHPLFTPPIFSPDAHRVRPPPTMYGAASSTSDRARRSRQETAGRDRRVPQTCIRWTGERRWAPALLCCGVAEARWREQDGAISPRCVGGSACHLRRSAAVTIAGCAALRLACCDGSNWLALRDGRGSSARRRFMHRCHLGAVGRHLDAPRAESGGATRECSRWCSSISTQVQYDAYTVPIEVARRHRDTGVRGGQRRRRTSRTGSIP